MIMGRPDFWDKNTKNELSVGQIQKSYKRILLDIRKD